MRAIYSHNFLFFSNYRVHWLILYSLINWIDFIEEFNRKYTAVY
jgi:hypothetical protein